MPPAALQVPAHFTLDALPCVDRRLRVKLAKFAIRLGIA